MAFDLPFSPKTPPLIGLDIGSSSVKIVELSEAGKGVMRLERYAIEPLPRGAVVDGNIDKIEIVADAVKRVDLTGDGMDDFVPDVGSVNCDGAASIYGDREKGVTVYVGDGKGGATSAFSDSAYAAAIEEAGSAASLWLTVSGERCGKAPAQDFANENFCDRAIVWNAGTRKFDFAPVATVRMIE